MSDDALDRMVEQYLDELEAASRGLPGDRRRELVNEIDQHVREARRRAQPESEASVREVLERTGRPTDIAAAASGAEVGAGGTRSRHALGLVGAGLSVVALAVGLGLFASSSAPSASVPPSRVFVVTPPAIKVVPSYVGMPMDKAVNLVQDESYWRATCSVTGVYAGRVSVVASQSPEGVRLREGQTVHFDVLVGRAHHGRYTVEPQLILSPVSCATIDLHQAGLGVTYRTQRGVLSAGQKVYSQSPDGGEQLVAGTVVHLVVSAP